MAYFINWDKIPEGYDWVVINQNGEVRAHKTKPAISDLGQYWVSILYKGIPVVDLINDQPNWQQLIFHRHESQAGY